jgi:magnesium transporter
MLYLNTGLSSRQPLEPDPHAAAQVQRAVWIDLLSPTEEERSAAERGTGLRVPAQADLAEIENSSRLSSEGQVLYLSTPMTYRTLEGRAGSAPLGFVLSPERLLTVRYADMMAFDSFARRFTGSEAQPSSAGAFLGLLEAIVDRLADVLEHAGADLDAISRRIFRPASPKQRNAARIDAELRATLRAVGRAGERVSNVRDSLLGVQRIVAYTHDVAAWFPKEMYPRFKTLRQDIASLSDHDTQLNNKVQFLLDATLGLISIEQNNGIKILTVVSVVGVPPTLMASIYGMNFKAMPELQWEYGYVYGLIVIVLSGIIPFVWFKKRGWI